MKPAWKEVALLTLSVAFPTIFAIPGLAQSVPAPGLTGAEIVERAIPSVAVVLVGDDRGNLLGAGSAVVIASNGVLVTAYHVIRGKPAVQIRFKNRETYDQVEIVAVDERRDVAVLRVPAVGLTALPVGRTGELRVGDAVYVVSNRYLLEWTASSGILSAVRPADDIPGAGSGYRLLQFTAPVSPGSSGGALVDSQGNAVGLVVATGIGQNNNFAVPFESVVGLARAQEGVVLESARELYLPRDVRNAAVPEATDAEAGELIEEARAVCIVTHTPSFPTETLAAELLKRADFRALRLKLVLDERAAELVIEIAHPLGFWDYSYVVIDRKTSVVIGSGSVIAWDGIRAAPPMAKKIMASLRTALQAVEPELKRR